jgi:hypothetical protein
MEQGVRGDQLLLRRLLAAHGSLRQEAHREELVAPSRSSTYSEEKEKENTYLK